MNATRTPGGTESPPAAAQGANEGTGKGPTKFAIVDADAASGALPKIWSTTPFPADLASPLPASRRLYWYPTWYNLPKPLQKRYEDAGMKVFWGACKDYDEEWLQSNVDPAAWAAFTELIGWCVKRGKLKGGGARAAAVVKFPTWDHLDRPSREYLLGFYGDTTRVSEWYDRYIKYVEALERIVHAGEDGTIAAFPDRSSDELPGPRNQAAYDRVLDAEAAAGGFYSESGDLALPPELGELPALGEERKLRWLSAPRSTALIERLAIKMHEEPMQVFKNWDERVDPRTYGVLARLFDWLFATKRFHMYKASKAPPQRPAKPPPSHGIVGRWWKRVVVDRINEGDKKQPDWARYPTWDNLYNVERNYLLMMHAHAKGYYEAYQTNRNREPLSTALPAVVSKG